MTPTVDVGANDVDDLPNDVDVGVGTVHFRTLERNRQGPEVDGVTHSVD